MPEEESSSNINSLWLKSIFEQLILIKDALALASDGFRTMEEVMSLRENVKSEIQIRNFRLITTLFSTLLDDVRPIIKPKFYKDTKKMLSVFRQCIMQDRVFFDVIINQRDKTNYKRLKPNFEEAIQKINEARAELILQLKDTLYYFDSEETI